ncbi:MAG TPA: hypothetical protein VF403_18695, partial [Kofleriaceae bacterium]
MNLRLGYVCLALASSASAAFAGPEVRDHRNDAPTVNDHRSDGGTSVETTHYHRRPGPRFM